MQKRLIALNIAVILLLASCTQAGLSTLTPGPAVTPTILPTSTPGQLLPGASSILLEQGFESETSANAFPLRGSWTITPDENDNHVFCNGVSEDWTAFRFGGTTWQNYAVEMRIKFVDQNPDQSVEIYSRINTGYDGYRATIGNRWGSLAFYAPSENLGDFYFYSETNTWYVLRVEAYGSQIRFFVDGELKTQADDSQRLEGMAGFGVAPGTLACVDDIRAWALTGTGEIGQAPVTLHPDLELVSDQAVTGDGGNQWGGHQTRIVRTQDGVFTAYTIEGGGHFAREWQLAWRQADGTWQVAAKGDAGREPVNLLASPDGTLHIIAWPNGTGTMLSGKPQNGQVVMTAEKIPGVTNADHGNWPYQSAGIDADGDLCILSSWGGETPGGEFRLACYLPAEGQWITKTIQLDYRYCYTYVFPASGGQVSLVSTRDVRWGALGYTQPPDVFEYVFNAIGFWHSGNVATEPLQRTFFQEEVPTDAFPYAFRDGQEDAYLDTSGNMHILYHLQGESTQGIYTNRHVILSPEGKVLTDVALPEELGGFARIFQGVAGDFYILGSSGVLYPAGMDGITLGAPINIDLKSYVVEYSGFALDVPRTGTPISNVLDVVFPSGEGTQWVYFQLPIPEP